MTYRAISSWIVKCQRMEAEVEQIRGQLWCSKEMDRATLEAFKEELETFRVRYRQPYRGATPSSDIIDAAVNIEMGQMMDERHQVEVERASQDEGLADACALEATAEEEPIYAELEWGEEREVTLKEFLKSVDEN